MFASRRPSRSWRAFPRPFSENENGTAHLFSAFSLSLSLPFAFAVAQDDTHKDTSPALTGLRACAAQQRHADEQPSEDTPAALDHRLVSALC